MRRRITEIDSGCRCFSILTGTSIPSKRSDFRSYSGFRGCLGRRIVLRDRKPIRFTTRYGHLCRPSTEHGKPTETAPPPHPVLTENALLTRRLHAVGYALKTLRTHACVVSACGFSERTMFPCGKRPLDRSDASNRAVRVEFPARSTARTHRSDRFVINFFIKNPYA